jgi:hypothetical protein
MNAVKNDSKVNTENAFFQIKKVCRYRKNSTQTRGFSRKLIELVLGKLAVLRYAVLFRRVCQPEPVEGPQRGHGKARMPIRGFTF